MKRILCLLMIAVSICSFAADKQGSKKYGRHRIVVRQELPVSQAVDGELPPEDIVPSLAKRFFDALDALPEGFVKRSGLSYVTFLENPTLNGVPCSGVASGDTIILSVSFSPLVVYHELFHIFDPQRQNKKWTKLNDPKFVYTGSDFYPARLKRSKAKRKEQNLTEAIFDADFVSRYAMSNELEDRAETFAYMVCEKKDFLKRVEKSPVLWKKMIYIINMTDRNKLLGKDFWQDIFEVEDLSSL